MIALKLVRLIEAHSEELARALMRDVERSSKLGEFKKLIPHKELETRVREVYQHLSDWLLDKTDHDLFVAYTSLGKRRFEQGVPFHEFVWALMLSKHTLYDFLEHEVVEESSLQLRSEFELMHALDQFYEKSLYYAALGYWEAHEFAEREEHHAVVG